jgi:hypothetical protein
MAAMNAGNRKADTQFRVMNPAIMPPTNAITYPASLSIVISSDLISEETKDSPVFLTPFLSRRDTVRFHADAP